MNEKGWGLKEIMTVKLVLLSIQAASRIICFNIFPDRTTASFVNAMVTSAGQILLIPVILYYMLIIYNLNINQTGLKLKGSLHLVYTALKISSALTLYFVFAFNIPLAFGSLKLDGITPLVEVSSIPSFSDSLAYFFIIFTVLIIPVLAEEIYYRSFLYPYLRRKIGIILGCFFSALLFSAFQFNFSPAVLTANFTIGLICVITFEIHETILPQIVFRTLLKTSIIIYVSGWIIL